jgi:hypothetical protein
MRTFSVTLLLTLLACSAAAQEEYIPDLQKDRLVAIAACKTESCVDTILERAPYLDPPLRLIAASKLKELGSAAAAERLVEAIPADPVSFWFCYSVTMPSLGKRFKPVVTLYQTFFPAVAVAAAEQGRLHDYLVMRSFADGEIAAAISEDVKGVKTRNPAAYCAALKTLHDELRRYVPECGKTR